MVAINLRTFQLKDLARLLYHILVIALETVPAEVMTTFKSRNSFNLILFVAYVAHKGLIILNHYEHLINLSKP